MRIMRISNFFGIQLPSWWKKSLGLPDSSPSSEGPIQISEYYGIGSKAYGEDEFGHFLILPGQPIPLPIKLLQGDSQAKKDYLLKAPFLKGPDVKARDKNIVADANVWESGLKDGMTLGQQIDELGQAVRTVPEGLEFLEDVIRVDREAIKDEFLQEAAKQRKSGSSLIAGLEVQARHASSQPNSGIDLARQQQLPRSLSRIKSTEYEDAYSLYLSDKKRPFESWTRDSISMLNYGIIGRESYLDVDTPLWRNVDTVTNQIVRNVREAIIADPGSDQNPTDGIYFRVKLRTSSIREIKIRCQLAENLASISSIIGGSTSLVEDRLRGGRDAAVILLLGMENFIKTMSENYCFTGREIDMSGIMMGTLKESAWVRANAVVVDRCSNPDVIELTREKVIAFLGQEAMSTDAVQSVFDYLVGGTRQGTDLPFFENRKADHMSNEKNFRFYMTVMKHIIMSVQLREPNVMAKTILENPDNYPEFKNAVDSLTARIADASCLGIYGIHNCARYVDELNRIQVDIENELTDLKNSTTEALGRIFDEHQGPFVDAITGDFSKELRDRMKNILARHLYLTISLNRAYTLKYIYLTNELVIKEKMELNGRTLMIVDVIKQNLADCLKYLPNLYNLYARKEEI